MKKSNVLVIVLSILVLGMGAYLIYDKVIVSNDNDTKVNEESKEENNKAETLDINDILVQELYNNFNLVGPDHRVGGELNSDSTLFDLVKADKKITVNDISNELKNYYGYRRLAISDIYSDMCSEHEKIATPENNKTGYYCGDSSFYDNYNINTLTTVFKESTLKEKVENIFGKGTYQRTSYFEISLWEGYIFDETTKEYIYGNGQMGGTGPSPEFTLISAEKINNQIIIIENAKLEQNDSTGISQENSFNFNIKYTFNLEDGHYYFNSVEKVA